MRSASWQAKRALPRESDGGRLAKESCSHEKILALLISSLSTSPTSLAQFTGLSLTRWTVTEHCRLYLNVRDARISKNRVRFGATREILAL